MTSWYAHKRLVTAFNWAKDTLKLIDDNPVSQVRMQRPHYGNADESVITEVEAKALVDGFPDHLRHAPLILLWTGLRLGELLELRIKDLDGLNEDEQMVFAIRRDMQDTDKPGGGKEVIINVRPKSDMAKRDIYVPAFVADAVRRHLEDADKRNPEDLIVSRRNLGQFTQNNFRTHYFTPAKKKAGRNDIGPHSCRRFYGTQLVRLVMKGSMSLEEARRLMGHETTEQLMDYMRADRDYRERAAAALDDLGR